MANAVGQPGHGGEHAEPAQGAHDCADFLVLGEESPLAKENGPVALLRAHQGQCRTACVGHVAADVGKILEQPVGAECEAGGFALAEEIDGA